MPQTDSAETAAHSVAPRFSSQFDSSDGVRRPNDGPLELLLHELRSPLAAIQNAIAVLRLGDDEDSLRRRMHELIERQVRQIALLTTSLIQPRGLAIENVSVRRTRIDLGAVVTRALETAAPEFHQRLNQVVLSLPESSTWVFGDASRLEQAFVNLLSNASKYSDVGGEIVVSIHVENGQAVVRVRDRGIGIAATSMPFIFGLFVRSDSEVVRSRPGLGIGLALVRSILASHEATVSAASEGIGQGSEFTVRLKMAT